MTTPKTLLLLRHAKAETGSADQEDRARVLTPRGKADAATIGHYLREHKLRPQQVLCSSALRTRETLAELQTAIGHDLPVSYSDALYLASTNELLAALAQTPDSVTTVLLIGHNPDLHQLALKLAAGGEEEAVHHLSTDFPTAALAVLELGETSWADTGRAHGHLTHFVTGKALLAAG